MADKVDPRTGEVVTVNYGWVKPTVGASVDAWGGYINTDLDGIDSTVHGIQASVPAASSTTPAMDGTAAVGTGTTYARADHVHPVDTSRYAATNPSGYQTAAQVTASLAPYAPLASPALTGTPTAPTAAPGTSTTQVATTAFVSALPTIGDNRIINGDMRIDQRNNGASGTVNGLYTADRWQFGSNLGTKGNWQRPNGVDANLSALGFGSYLAFSSNSAYTLAAGDYFQFTQYVEADMIADFAWGTSNAKPVTLSFTVLSVQTGTFSGSIRNGTASRSYAFTYSIPASNTWTKISVTIPGDTGGTWVLVGNGAGLCVAFSLGMGSTFSTASGAWVNGNFSGATGSVSIVSSATGFFGVTGVKLEVGSVATPFNRQSLTKSLADCQRYFSKTYLQSQVPGMTSADSTALTAYLGPNANAANYVGVVWVYPVTMRAAPTITLYSPHTGASGKAYAQNAAADLAASAFTVSDATASILLNGVSTLAADLGRFHATVSAEY